MKLKNYFFLLLLAVFSFTATAQENATENVEQGVAGVGTFYLDHVAPSIQSRGPAPAMDMSPKEARDKRSLRNQVIPGKDPQTQDDYFVRNPSPYAQSVRSQPPTVVFDAYTSGSQPTDPSIAVGPNHLFVVFNTGFAIYDKAGNDVGGGQRPVTDIFSSGGCCDLTASYDQAAQRWVISYLWSSNGQIQVAVSDGPDPTTAMWNVYTIPGVQDYNKLSVWSDGYYVTSNGAGNRVWALERDEMIAGNAAASFQTFILPGIVTSGFQSPQALNVSDDTMPAAGGATIIYLQDDAWGGVATDHFKLWTIDVDWATPANSTISAATEFPTQPYISVFDGGSFSNLTQPGGGPAVDALQATVMNQAQFRKFGTHNSALFNWVVDTDAGSGELAGIRWFELRQTADGQPWTLFQEGTYTAPDGRHAWHASLIMNAAGDIGMGYTSMSGPTTASTVRISSYYTGRFAADPVNTMTIAEEVIANGNANIPGTRYGDYSKIDIDPSDDTTFWFINEYMNSGRKGVVGAFQLAPPMADDIGVTTIDQPNSGPLTATEDIVVSIRNFGSNDITDPMVQYDIDGGTPVQEMYSGTIAAAATVSFTFAAQADLSVAGTYVINATTLLPGDSNTANDAATKTVVNGVLVCEPAALLGCNLDGIKMFVLNTITADDGGNGCNTEPASSPAGYADRTAMSTPLSNEAGSNVYTLQSQHNWDQGAGVEAISVWIDFDDSGTFEVSERLISGEFYTTFGALEDFTLTVPVGAAAGTHKLRAKSIDTSAGGDVLDPCLDSDYGEVQDYTVVVGTLGVNDVSISEAELVILTKENNQFDISLVTSFEGRASIAIFNMLGQQVAFNNLEKEGDSYNYKLNMSYAAAGIYLVKMGDRTSKTFKTAKIVVK